MVNEKGKTTSEQIRKTKQIMESIMDRGFNEAAIGVDEIIL